MWEKVFCVVVIVIGAISHAYTVAKISTVVSSLRTSERKFFGKLRR